MRPLACAVLVFAALSGAAAAAPVCSAGSQEPFEVSAWSVQPASGSNGAAVTLAFSNRTGKILVGTDASAEFFDAADATLGSIELAPDIALPPEGLGSTTIEAPALAPLLQHSPETIAALICVRRLVFEDGSVKRSEPIMRPHPGGAVRG